MDRVIQVRVVPRAKRNEVKEDSGGYKVYLTAAPVDGKANKALLEVLAGYLNVKRSRLKMIKGEKSRDKAIRITGL
jgi:uncharacterized protein (TIGR00251 family)